ncbi:MULTISPECIES: hypothetical protein [unclassified Psychrobacillus]|uniref:hypothetical protein n=1 Tax=unclassified Psychrobacillus TaxID=2636677 RepID=UPI0030F60627
MANIKEQSTAIQLFYREDGTISIWDHPNFKSSLAIPDSYFPLTRVEQAMEMVNTGKLTEMNVRMLKVIGDAICANENQIKRYMSSLISSGTTSKHLRYLMKYGFVERHKCRLKFIEEDGKEVIRPPGPITLGIAGYKLLKRLHSESQFMDPDSWNDNPYGVQRYVATNEIRCLAIESRNARAWEWHPSIGGNAKYKKPLAVTRIETPKGEVQLLLERAQMSQDFIGYFRTRFEQYRYLFNRDNRIQVDGFPESFVQVFVISVSSISMAKFIQEQIRLHTFPFDVWFVVDEWIDAEGGLENAFASVTKEGIKRFRAPFLRKQQVIVPDN